MSIAAFESFVTSLNIQATEDRAILLNRAQKSRAKEKPGFSTRAKEITDDSGTINNVAKLGKSVLGLLAGILKNLPWLGTTAKVFADTADVIKLFAVGKDVDDIAKGSKALKKTSAQASAEEKKAIKEKNIDNRLKITSCTLDVASIGLTGAKIITSVKLVDVGAKLAALLGRIPVVGVVAAAWAPLGSLAALVSVAKGSVDIAQGARKIITLKNQKSGDVGTGKLNLDQKKAQWSAIAESGEMDWDLIGNKINHLTVKEHKAREAKRNLEDGWESKSKDLQDKDAAAKIAKAEAAGKSPLKIAKKFKAAKAERQANKAAKAYEGYMLQWTATSKRANALRAERFAWNEIDPADENHKEILKSLAERKVEKYDIKLKNNSWNVGKEAVGIGLNTVLVIASIASIVLTGLAIVSSFAMIPLAAAFLAVSVFGITLHFLKKRQDKEYQSVQLSNDYKPQPQPQQQLEVVQLEASSLQSVTDQASEES